MELLAYLTPDLRQWLQELAHEEGMTLLEVLPRLIEEARQRAEEWPPSPSEPGEQSLEFTLPDYLIAELARRADPRAFAQQAIEGALETLSYRRHERKSLRRGEYSLRDFHEYPSEAAYLLAAVDAAYHSGENIHFMAHLAAGIAAVEMGRTHSMEEVHERFERMRPLRNQRLEAWQRQDRLEEYGRELLRREMRAISERLYGAGWRPDLEFLLWRAIQQEPDASEGELVCLSSAERSPLRQLSQDADAWWVWDAVRKREICLEMEEWQALLAQRDAGSG